MQPRPTTGREEQAELAEPLLGERRIGFQQCDALLRHVAPGFEHLGRSVSGNGPPRPVPPTGRGECCHALLVLSDAA